MLPRARSPVGDVGAPGARPEEGAASSSWNVGGPASGVDAGRSRGRSGKRPGSADHTVALGTAIQGLRGRFPPQSGFRAEGESARFRAGVGAPTAWGEATRSGEGWMPPTAWGRLPSGQLAVSVPVLWRRGPCRGFPAGALTPPLWFPQMASLRAHELRVTGAAGGEERRWPESRLEQGPRAASPPRGAGQAREQSPAQNRPSGSSIPASGRLPVSQEADPEVARELCDDGVPSSGPPEKQPE
ncbi:unnamed protein product [Rangifer tarandus platyrhynchus]|uniref:Uncharacterized protein n=1 Tax=Rangifer tarandus platyrhynchus TaxID=3082113 RepID=A0ABN8Y9Y3_RANTA|nr:unnamed protein product [Rangifer tarandus platyrhynchus]